VNIKSSGFSVLHSSLLLLLSKELSLSLYKKILEAFAQSIFHSCSLYNHSLIIDYIHSTLLKQECICSTSFSQSSLVKENKKDNYGFGWLINQFIPAVAAGSGHWSTS